MTLILLALFSVATAQAARPYLPPDAVEDALAYVQTDRTKAIQILEDALERAPTRESAVIAAHLGEQYRLAGDEDAARDQFEAAASSRDKVARQIGRVGSILVDAHRGVNARDLKILRGASERLLPDTQNAERYLLLAVEAARRDDPRATGTYAARALSFAKADPATADRVPEVLRSLEERSPDQASSAGDGSPLDRAREALRRGNRDRAAALAREILASAEPGSDEALTAAYLVRRATDAAPVDPSKIAVLLPLSGKYEGAARLVRQALEMGFQAQGGTHQLVYLDSGADPETAVAALERAVFEEGVIAVVGPLLAQTTEAVVRAADAMEVPLLSLSQSNEEAERPWVFQAVPSVGDQAEALARHTMVHENMERFAIFAPDTPYGHQASEAFRKAVESRRGTITAEVYYDPASTALMPFAAKLGKKDDPSRKGELWRLKKAATEAGRDPSTVVLPPIVDFDAIFLPDSARNIPIACAALAYEEFPIGEFRPRKGDTLIPLLGLNGWNRPSLVSAGGEYVRNSRFTDAYVPSRHRSFAATYKERTGRTPSSLEAITVDAGRLLGAVSAIGGSDREAFREALGRARVQDAVTGLTRLDGHRADTPITILTITRSGIEPLEPSPTDQDPARP